MSTTHKSTGPYDTLYATSPENILWGSKPGRLITRAVAAAGGLTAIDIGCGDGKNSIALERFGFHVTGCDSSRLAMTGLAARFAREEQPRKGEYIVCDAMSIPWTRQSCDLLVSYGLYHCLSPSHRLVTHKRALDAVRVGGVACFTCLTDTLHLPKEHATSDLYLASASEVMSLYDGWDIFHFEEGLITESHPPLVGQHHHSAVWLLARKRK